MKKFAAILVLSLSVFSFSEAFAAVIEDPQAFLKTLETNRAKAEFADAFRLGDQITLRIFSTDCKWGCGADGCGSLCTTVNADFEKKIAEATADSATAVSTDGSTETYDRAEFEAGGKQYLRKSLETLDVYLGMNGKVVLTSLVPVDFALADGTKIPAYTLRADFVTPVNSMEVEYTVAKGPVPGLAEILFLKIGAFHGEGGEKMFKVKAVSRAH